MQEARRINNHSVNDHNNNPSINIMTQYITSSLASAVGVCVLPSMVQNRARTISHPHYIHEIFAHAGLCYITIGFDQLIEHLPQLRVFITIGEMELPGEISAAIRAWVEQGGAWLSIAGICGLGEALGAEYVKPEYSGPGFGVVPERLLGEGYLDSTQPEHPLLSHLRTPLHFFNGLTLQAAGQGQSLATIRDVHGRATEYSAVIENRFGNGRCLLLAPDAVGAIVKIQQGVAVTRDGNPPSDGSAPTSDGVLKADDGIVLDWHFDRQEVPGLPGLKAFIEPVGDAWRELILRAVFHLAAQQNVLLPLLWLYPRNLPAIAHMSHDSDGNDAGAARELIKQLDIAAINSTWCIIAPGYEPEIINAIVADGHELAMHYDAMTEGIDWGEDNFEQQWQFLQQQFGELPVSNKNHYTRWEGDTEFFEWCQKRGIQLDQSKGPSKIGESGYAFGTCHPYFPVAPNGALLDVLELTFTTQDLTIFVPTTIAPAMLDAAVRAHGIWHVLFHPAHTTREAVAAALQEAVTLAKERGLEWWTAQRINTWERARRGAQWSSDSGTGVLLHTSEALPEATLLFLHTDIGNIKINSQEYSGATTTRWGFEFQAITLDLEAGGQYSISMEGNQ